MTVRSSQPAWPNVTVGSFEPVEPNEAVGSSAPVGQKRQFTHLSSWDSRAGSCIVRAGWANEMFVSLESIGQMK